MEEEEEEEQTAGPRLIEIAHQLEEEEEQNTRHDTGNQISKQSYPWSYHSKTPRTHENNMSAVWYSINSVLSNHTNKMLCKEIWKFITT